MAKRASMSLSGQASVGSLVVFEGASADQRSARQGAGRSRRWDERKDAFLREHYPTSKSAVLAEVLGCTLRQVYARAHALGLKKDEKFLVSPQSGRLQPGDRRGASNWFKPGVEAWNRGVQGRTGTQDACRQTQFKPGSKPHNWLRIGSLRVNGDGVLEEKFADAKGSPSARWRPVARRVWEQAYGPIPPGRCVVFRPGRASVRLEDITPDALECIDRVTLMQRNAVHAMPGPLAEIVRLRATLTRTINHTLEKKTCPSPSSN